MINSITDSNSQSVPYLRFPSPSPDGNTIAFSYAGDIFIVSSDGGEARQITSHTAYDDSPKFSPDGKYLAFTSKRTGNGDIYVISLENGSLKRLTYHDAMDTLGCWSPDGGWLYFSSDRDVMGMASYKVNIGGGTPIRTAFAPYESHYNLAISPDGKTLAFNNNGAPWWRRGPHPSATSDIWLVSETPGTLDYKKITNHPGRNLHPMWRNDCIYFVSDRNENENIWCKSLADGETKQITHFEDGRLLRASISYDGNWIVFERDFKIWKLNTNSGEAEFVGIRVKSDQKTNPISHKSYSSDIHEFTLSPDSKKIAFAVRGEIFAVSSEKGGDAFRVTETHFRESQLCWHPNSKKLVYVSDRFGDNEVFLFNFVTREEVRLTDSSATKSMPKFSPDGKYISFFHGRKEVHLMDVESKEIRPFIRGLFLWGVGAPSSYYWSPDSKWIAFIAQDKNYFSNLYVQNIEEEEARQISFLGNISGGGVIWSSDGKFIIFNTGQYRAESQIARVDLKPLPSTFKEDEFDKLFEEEEEKPESPDAVDKEHSEDEQGKTEKKKDEEKEPVEIQFKDIKHRLSLLTHFKQNANALAISPDSKTLIFKAAMTGKENLWSLLLEPDKKSEPPKQLTSTSGEKGSVYFIPDGKKIYYLDGRKIQHRPLPDGDIKGLSVKAEFDVDFHLEKMQMFEEAWRLIRDHFYDASFNGSDWLNIRDKFRPAIIGVQNQADFRNITSLMLGELNASHLGCGGGGGSNNTGYLGVTFDQSELTLSGHCKITEILSNAPIHLAKEPINVGEYILSINGEILNGTKNFYELMHRKAGKRLTLKVNDKPEMEGAREVNVQPVNGGTINNLRYKNWVQENSKYVDRISNGRLGYVHIRGMNYDNFVQFQADLDAEAHNKEGVIVDVRFNGGGHIASFILDVLQRRAYTISSYRGEVSTPSTNLAGNRLLDKPTILVQNEHSGSNAEMFSEGYRRLGLGKVVGMPSAGAVIWTWDWKLLDGSNFRLPRMRVSTLTGENLEGTSRSVNFQVKRPLGEATANRDSQLDVAVEKLLQQIDNRNC